VNSGLPAPDPPLDPRQRARGRRLAIASHPFGMTFHTAFTSPLPTLALLSRGASETLVGLQSAVVFASLLLQLPILGAVARVSKRRILVTAHVAAMIGAAPLLCFREFATRGGAGAQALALLCFAATAAGIGASNTVWFPLLRGYVEPSRVGRFFGVLRTGWHLTLIAFFLGSQAWLARHPGDFAPLFAAAWLCGVARIALIVRLPERSERTGARVRVREALSLLREPQMRRYLAGVAWGHGARVATLPFVLVMLRREVGLSEAEIVLTTVAGFAGGLASLYLWGRAVDRVGPAPVFRWTCAGMGALVLSLAAVSGGGTGTAVAMAAFFLAHSALSAGFGVADTHVLFGLTPDHAPSRALVLGSVAVGCVAGLTPLLAGGLLETGLAGAVRPGDRLEVYRGFFAGAALLQALAFLPLRGFTRAGDAGRSP
jgi:MFS family permease